MDESKENASKTGLQWPRNISKRFSANAYHLKARTASPISNPTMRTSLDPNLARRSGSVCKQIFSNRSSTESMPSDCRHASAEQLCRRAECQQRGIVPVTQGWHETSITAVNGG